MTATIIHPDFRRARREWPPVGQCYGIDWHRTPVFSASYDKDETFYVPPEPDQYDAVNIEPLPWPEATRRIVFACAVLWITIGLAWGMS